MELPQDFVLEQNHPNPFNPSTTFRYGLPTQSEVRLTIYDILGQKVQEVMHGIQDAGYHEIEWSANVASGLYLYQLDATSITETGKKYTQMKKMVLLK
jgi:flagellar hook assembly protein FlgD